MDLLYVFGLGSASCLCGLFGIVGIIILYCRNICRKNIGKRFSNNKDLIAGKKMHIFRKMEIVTITCTVLAAVCDVLTVYVVRTSGLVNEFQALSVNGCFASASSLLLSEIASMFAQIELLGWLEIGFDVFDVLISLAFIREEFHVNQEVRAQLKMMKDKTVEMHKAGSIPNSGGVDTDDTPKQSEIVYGTGLDGFRLDGDNQGYVFSFFLYMYIVALYICI